MEQQESPAQACREPLQSVFHGLSPPIAWQTYAYNHAMPSTEKRQRGNALYSDEGLEEGCLQVSAIHHPPPRHACQVSSSPRWNA